MSKTPANHYIDNKEFYQAMIEWKKLVVEAEESDDGRPPVTEYIGKCFLDIAEHLSYRPNFINYPYKDEMVGDGIENCLMYAHNFDPEKSNKPSSVEEDLTASEMLYKHFQLNNQDIEKFTPKKKKKKKKKTTIDSLLEEKTSEDSTDK